MRGSSVAGESFYLSSLLLRGTHMGRLNGVTADALEGNHVASQYIKQQVIITARPCFGVQSPMTPASRRRIFGSSEPSKIPRRLLISRPMCMISPRPSGVEGVMLNASSPSILCGFAALHPFPLTRPRDTHTLLIAPTANSCWNQKA